MLWVLGEENQGKRTGKKSSINVCNKSNCNCYKSNTERRTEKKNQFDFSTQSSNQRQQRHQLFQKL